MTATHSSVVTLLREMWGGAARCSPDDYRFNNQYDFDFDQAPEAEEQGARMSPPPAPDPAAWLTVAGTGAMIAHGRKTIQKQREAPHSRRVPGISHLS